MTVETTIGRNRGIAPVGTERPVAVVITSITPRTQLAALLDALAGQSGLPRRRLPVFAAAGRRLREAGESSGRRSGGPGLQLHLFGTTDESPVRSDSRDALLAASAWLSRQGGDGVLMICDGAALPAPDWAAKNLAALEAGADVVLASHVIAPRPQTRSTGEGGSMIGLLARYHRLAVRLEDAIDPRPWDPAPRHGYETGASVALWHGTLGRAGGIPDVPDGMARHLIARIRQWGGKVRHCPRARVFVPPRLLCGFDMVSGPPATDIPFLVTEPEQLERAFRHRAALRKQLCERYATLPADERARAVRCSLALMTPAEIVSPVGMPVEQACERMEARLKQLGSSAWTSLPSDSPRPLREDPKDRPRAV